jgi:hypothetical protein
LPDYNAEQYCMNHPAFREAYGRYVRKLVTETDIDGLMSDDGIYYADWRACGCHHCRERFRREYGRELPQVADAGFWGNRRSEAFRDWIEIRFAAVRLPRVAELLVIPAWRCLSSDGHASLAYGMSYQIYPKLQPRNVSKWSVDTHHRRTWDDRISPDAAPRSRDHRAPCFGLGYGHFDNAPSPGFSKFSVPIAGSARSSADWFG